MMTRPRMALGGMADRAYSFPTPPPRPLRGSFNEYDRPNLHAHGLLYALKESHPNAMKLFACILLPAAALGCLASPVAAPGRRRPGPSTATISYSTLSGSMRERIKGEAKIDIATAVRELVGACPPPPAWVSWYTATAA